MQQTNNMSESSLDTKHFFLHELDIYHTTSHYQIFDRKDPFLPTAYQQPRLL